MPASRVSCVARSPGVLSLTTLFVIAIAAGCRQEVTRWDAAQEATDGKKTSVADSAIDGGELNQFFPKQGAAGSEGYDIVFLQEKQGMAQASLRKGGEELAVLSIFDTNSNPEARDKFAGAEKVAGHPAIDETKSLSALVGNRFQVQIRSMATGFGKSDRQAWLEKFDLLGISEIE